MMYNPSADILLLSSCIIILSNLNSPQIRHIPSQHNDSLYPIGIMPIYAKQHSLANFSGDYA